MRVVVTGANGFIGKNLCFHLEEKENNEVLPVVKETSTEQLREVLSKADIIYHVAGVNRPENDAEFRVGNVGALENILNVLAEKQKAIPIVLSSSVHATVDNPYGKSKLDAEELLLAYSKEQNVPVYIFRLPNVFGKWCRPNYNSVVATFCYNIVNDQPITIHDERAELSLVYIDDVCATFVSLCDGQELGGYKEIDCQYHTTVGELAVILRGFRESRSTLITEEVGIGLKRALYATYLSYLTPDEFTYTLPSYGDQRGVFCEMLKTRGSGQFSFFTAGVGVTRGGHYHHTKNEKFLVVSGKARFRFQHVVTGEKYELVTTSEDFRVVETVPGWSHDVTNIGEDELIVMLWANEIFDSEQPDTVTRVIE